MKDVKNKILIIFIIIFLLGCNDNTGTLKIIDKIPSEKIVISYEDWDTGGNTSVANDLNFKYKWSGDSPFPSGGFGYFTDEGVEVPYIKRQRDLGQSFRNTIGREIEISSIIVRLGFGDNVIRPGMYGQNVSLQFFEVEGGPIINNNGTKTYEQAYHGYPHDRRNIEIPGERDDFYTGELYKTVAVFQGFTFPSKRDFGFNDDSEVDPNNPALKGKLLRFQLPKNSNLVIKPERQYAFIIMVNKPGPQHGFTLANKYYGNYEHGHGIRREGLCDFPPVSCNPLKDLTDAVNENALSSANFPENFKERIKIQPGTNGYPDVCTWRDLNFYVEMK